MKRNQFLLAVSAVALGGVTAIGCGDNSRECGPGTEDMNGVCVGGGGSVCANGTILNETTNECEVDPNACQDGTVLVDGQCVDEGRVDANLEEGPEPNGLGLFGELSGPEGAGSIDIGPVGTSFVIHGVIEPNQDADLDGQLEPDIDSYIIDVTAPVLVDVSADGIN